MKKIFALIALATATATMAVAQSSAGASQTIQIEVTDAIEIAFVGTGASTGATVDLNFSTINNYANGVESSAQTMRVRSTRRFDVSVEANTNYFTYAGATSPAPQMKVADVLKMKVTSNNTGGQVNNSYNNYYAINTQSTGVINNGTHGDEQTFAVQYKATPGYSFPAGSYTVDMLYTATLD